MLSHKAIETYLLSMPQVRLDYPFGPQAAVYKIGSAPDAKMFAIISEGSQPVRLSLKCDPILAGQLRQKYETVLPGYHLNKKHWNTIICSGQLSDEEIYDLIRHSYQLVATA